jgi:preprotein translocase subunit Sec63
MEHLDFILWMVLFPISLALEGYISAKKKQITGEKEKQYSKDAERRASVFIILVWFFVGYLLF